MELQQAIDVLAAKLREDEGYFLGWQANIAVSIQDAFAEAHYAPDALNEISNNAAKRFLNILCYKPST